MSNAGCEFNEPALSVEAVSKSYGDRKVLDNVSFLIGKGERLALTGPSGGGKTTLLNCVGGVDIPDTGKIRLDGTTLAALSSDQLAGLRRQKIGTIFQFFHLLPTLSAYENVELPLQLLGIDEAVRRARVNSIITRVGLSHRANALPSELSGGEQQRVAVARALVHKPAIVLADEPTGNLDSSNGQSVLQLLREMTDESGAALVLVTHSEDAARICHRRLVLRDGRIIPN